VIEHLPHFARREQATHYEKPCSWKCTYCSMVTGMGASMLRRNVWTSRRGMATMRDLLSVVDLLDQPLRPAQVSVGDVVYPPGGPPRARWQEDAQLVLVHTGSVIVSIDGIPGPPQTAGSACHFPRAVRNSPSRPLGTRTTHGCRRAFTHHRPPAPAAGRPTRRDSRLNRAHRDGTRGSGRRSYAGLDASPFSVR
jgi:hypothetical protein